MYKRLIRFITSSLLIACNSNENVDGGPCTYDDRILPARLVSFDTINAMSFDALFIIEDSSSMQWRDTIRYSALTHHHYLSAEDIAKDSLVTGNTYQYINRTIKTGSCNPKIDMLLLKLYREK